MKYNIQEEGNKLILEVELSPYRLGTTRYRQLFNQDNALKIIEENNYQGYSLYSKPENLDNKFTSKKGIYIFVKNNVDNKDESVLKSSKRRRRKSYNTDKQ